MELINIIPSESKLWEQAWRLYLDSFPEHERRRISSHSLAAEDPRFHTEVAIDNGNLTALIFYWIYGNNNIYIEHIAVNPLMRGRNIGTTLLKEFISRNKNSKIILEIDPPVDEVSIKRLSFYKKLGFETNPYHYIHPSYQKKGLAHKLEILSYPEVISQEEFDSFSGFMKNGVLKYID